MLLLQGQDKGDQAKTRLGLLRPSHKILGMRARWGMSWWKIDE